MRVLLFASAREAAGNRSVLRISLPPGSTLGDLLAGLRREYPGMDRILRPARVARNGEYVPPRGEASPLDPSDEIAILPPYSGG